MKIVVEKSNKSPLIPEGEYEAVLIGCEKLETDEKHDYQRLKFSFEVSKGLSKGTILMRSVGARVTPATQAGVILAKLMGVEALKADEEVDPSSFIGRSYRVSVETFKPKTGGDPFSTIGKIYGAGQQ